MKKLLIALITLNCFTALSADPTFTCIGKDGDKKVLVNVYFQEQEAADDEQKIRTEILVDGQMVFESNYNIYSEENNKIYSAGDFEIDLTNDRLYLELDPTVPSPKYNTLPIICND